MFLRHSTKWIDLTHPISPGMPVYPGTEPPVLAQGCTIDAHGFAEKKITMYSHTGTHIDAPAHMLKQGSTLDQLPIDHFCGTARVWEWERRSRPVISPSDLEPDLHDIREVDFLLLYTGWSRHWGTEAYFSNYPVLSPEAAEWISSTGLKGLGVDAISVDPADTDTHPVHKALLNREMILIENLTNLEELPGSPFFFSCFPLKIEEADGSPVRAVAWVEDGPAVGPS